MPRVEGHRHFSWPLYKVAGQTSPVGVERQDYLFPNNAEFTPSLLLRAKLILCKVSSVRRFLLNLLFIIAKGGWQPVFLPFAFTSSLHLFSAGYYHQSLILFSQDFLTANKADTFGLHTATMVATGSRRYLAQAQERLTPFKACPRSIIGVHADRVAGRWWQGSNMPPR